MKKFRFEVVVEYYGGIGAIVVFEESQEKAEEFLKALLQEEDFAGEELEFEDFDCEELPIKSPDKAYKGYYIEEMEWD